MAKRGWVPFSMSTTDLPSFRAMRARSEPAKPEPTMATSKDPGTDQLSSDTRRSPVRVE